MLTLEIASYNSSVWWFFYLGVFALLSLGTMSDVKTREVPNKISFGVLVLSVPLIYLNMANVGFWNFAYLGVFVMAYFRGLGGADLKVLFPLLFVFKNVMLFAVLLAVFGMAYFLYEHCRQESVPIRKLTIPYFVPIISAFIVMVIL